MAVNQEDVTGWVSEKRSKQGKTDEEFAWRVIVSSRLGRRFVSSGMRLAFLFSFYFSPPPDLTGADGSSVGTKVNVFAANKQPAVNVLLDDYLGVFPASERPAMEQTAGSEKSIIS